MYFNDLKQAKTPMQSLNLEVPSERSSVLILAAHKSLILSEKKTHSETFSFSCLKKCGSVGVSKKKKTFASKSSDDLGLCQSTSTTLRNREKNQQQTELHILVLDTFVASHQSTLTDNTESGNLFKIHTSAMVTL